MDPLQPVSSVLALTPLAPSCGGSFAELELSAWPLLREGEDVELRMAALGKPGQHQWPLSMRVLLDGVEVLQLQPAENQRRADAPLKLQKPGKIGSHLLQLFVATPPGTADPQSFVLCLVVVSARRPILDLVEECRQRPGISQAASHELLQSLRLAEVSVCSATPWRQPLTCPLTQERLREPARGVHCQHLQCFELEAFLVTTAAMPFHRRWRCPICDSPLPPEKLALCDLTRTFLREVLTASSASLDPALEDVKRVATSDTCDLTAEPVSEQVASPARVQLRRHWGRRLRCEVQQGGELD